MLTFILHRVEEVSQWQDRDIMDIRNDHGDILYDSVDPDTREEIHLDRLNDLPMLDETGDQIHLYTEDGFRIQRRLAGFALDVHPHGVLLNLRDIGLLFKSEESDTPFSVFPQAGLVTVGHIQAEGLVTPYLPLLQKLNSKVKVQDDDHMSDDDLDMPTCAPIVGIACQAYNALMHNTRGRTAQHHDAQRGLVTAALAGGYAKSDGNVKKQEFYKVNAETVYLISNSRKRLLTIMIDLWIAAFDLKTHSLFIWINSILSTMMAGLSFLFLCS